MIDATEGFAPFDPAADLDLGVDGRWLRWIAWAPDRALNPQYDGIADVERFAALVFHAAPDGRPCYGYIRFDSPTSRALEAMSQARDPAHARRPAWQVESWAPLTVSPSILCACGDHGYIRAGRWVTA